MHVAAEGPLKTLTILIVVIVAVLAAVTYSEPFSTEYEVKTAAKVACNGLIQDHVYKQPDKRSWEQPFLQRARSVGVQLGPQQYKFEPKLTKQTNSCHVLVAWRSTTPVAFVGDILGLPPLELVHRLDFVHQVKATW